MSCKLYKAGEDGVVSECVCDARQERVMLAAGWTRTTPEAKPDAEAEKKAASEKAASEKAASEKAASEKAASEKAAAKKEAAVKTGGK